MKPNRIGCIIPCSSGLIIDMKLYMLIQYRHGMKVGVFLWSCNRTCNTIRMSDTARIPAKDKSPRPVTNHQSTSMPTNLFAETQITILINDEIQVIKITHSIRGRKAKVWKEKLTTMITPLFYQYHLLVISHHSGLLVSPFTCGPIWFVVAKALGWSYPFPVELCGVKMTNNLLVERRKNLYLASHGSRCNWYDKNRVLWRNRKNNKGITTIMPEP